MSEIPDCSRHTPGLKCPQCDQEVPVTELLASIVVWLLIIIVAIVCVLTAFGLLELL